MIRKILTVALIALLPVVAFAANGDALSVGTAGYEFQVDESGNAIVAGNLSVSGAVTAVTGIVIPATAGVVTLGTNVTVGGGIALNGFSDTVSTNTTVGAIPITYNGTSYVVRVYLTTGP